MRSFKPECPTDVINWLAGRFGYRTYLEIGIQQRVHNFDRVNVELKHGVDIDIKVGATFTMAADEFFGSGHGLPAYDLIYVDADHRELPALRDLSHAVERLALGGTIVCDNVWPVEDYDFRCGDSGEAWKAWAYMRMSRPDLRMAVVAIRFGCGVIRRGRQMLFVPDEAPYLSFKEDPVVDRRFYEQYRDRLLNLIQPDQLPTWVEAGERSEEGRS
jgi:hypothetical protein